MECKITIERHTYLLEICVVYFDNVNEHTFDLI